ncbi:hypothetical protein EDB92DRAFT_1112909 [Lactarius akahatsu]|uniref:Uncharacterized protein n=1 Tax=Lactarius akahatsu TaxID=416441 RepID=A0AAD4QBR9_9AGAM|nr:hypothetical protein EDB92DRAFT_1112909 [Lactarius akahatsu]
MRIKVGFVHPLNSPSISDFVGTYGHLQLSDHAFSSESCFSTTVQTQGIGTIRSNLSTRMTGLVQTREGRRMMETMRTQDYYPRLGRGLHPRPSPSTPILIPIARSDTSDRHGSVCAPPLREILLTVNPEDTHTALGTASEPPASPFPGTVASSVELTPIERRDYDRRKNEETLGPVEWTERRCDWI